MALEPKELDQLQAMVNDLVIRKQAEDSAGGASDHAQAALVSAQHEAAVRLAEKNTAADATRNSLAALTDFVQHIAE